MTVTDIPLALPHGRHVTIAGDERDVSVVGALKSSDGVWEPHVRAVFERLVKPDWVCVDIGANIGPHTLALGVLARHVVAFEASPDNFTHLQKNVISSGMSDHVVPVLAAVSDSAGEMEVVGSPQFAGVAFATSDASRWVGQEHVNNVGGTDVRFTFRAHTVPALRLDDWVDEHRLPRLDLIKIDVEGGEQNVLAGAQRTLERYRPLFVTEYHLNAASWFFGASPESYFEALQRVFESIHAIEPDGSLSGQLAGWPQLHDRLSDGKGWEDLLCVPVPLGRARRVARTFRSRLPWSDAHRPHGGSARTRFGSATAAASSGVDG